MLPSQFHRFRPRLLDTLKGYGRPALLADIASGVTVGVVALPLAMAFAIASGVKPEQGIFTAIVAGLLISALGGSNVQIGGPAGAFIVIVYGIVERYGLTNLLISTAMAGVLLFLMGLFKLGALVRYVPVAIVIGFTNGIAVLIGLSQVKDFFGLSTPKLPGDFFALLSVLLQHAHTVNVWALAIAAASLLLVVLWPKSYSMPPTGAITLAARVRRAAAHVPGTIVVLVAAPLAQHVPLAALAGILLFVAWNMGEWREFARLRRFSIQYRTILVGTFLMTVIFDLTVAVQVGLILACAFFIYRMSTLFRVEPLPRGGLPEGVQVFELFGSLFFGAVGKVEQLPALLPEGTRAVVLEMHRLISMDTSGLDALEQLHRVLQRQGQALVLANVNEQPLSLIRRSGFEQRLGPDQIVPTVAAAFEDDPVVP